LLSRATIALTVFPATAVVAALGMDAQVKSPEAAMAFAKVFAAQSAGLAASAVAVLALPVRAAVMVVAAKLPDPSRATMVLLVFVAVAVVAALPTAPHVRSPFAAIALAKVSAAQSAGFA